MMAFDQLSLLELDDVRIARKLDRRRQHLDHQHTGRRVEIEPKMLAVDTEMSDLKTRHISPNDGASAKNLERTTRFAKVSEEKTTASRSHLVTAADCATTKLHKRGAKPDRIDFRNFSMHHIGQSISNAKRCGSIVICRRRCCRSVRSNRSRHKSRRRRRLRRRRWIPCRRHRSCCCCCCLCFLFESLHEQRYSSTFLLLPLARFSTRVTWR